jgi:hypothetical protein
MKGEINISDQYSSDFDKFFNNCSVSCFVVRWRKISKTVLEKAFS